jgi:hypothetical protein
VKLKRVKVPKPKAEKAADPFKVKPVSIHIHASGEHLQDAHNDLAKQLKPMGFTMKKKKGFGPKGSKKTIAESLSS